MAGTKTYAILIFWMIFLVKKSWGQAVITFTETNYVVQEGDMFTVQVYKTGAAASPVNVVVEVSLS